MKILKYLGIIVGVVILLVLCLAAYVKIALPNTGKAPEMTIERTPERLARGEYLANHVTICMDCHSTRDWSKYSGPMLQDSAGGGGEVFDQKFGFPGKWYAKNITPYALGDWTDGEIFHAVTTGVNKKGKALFPVMGYHRFGTMDEEDVKSIIAYIRTLEPVKRDIPEGEPDFPMNFIINTIPRKAAFQKIPPQTDLVAYGKYIINAAGCVECHSKREKGELVPGTEFGGGMEFKQPNGIIRSVNITMDKETGIGNWTKEMFIQRFKAYTDSSFVLPSLAPTDLNTPMPWTMYAGMKQNDLEAIYAYLQTVTPLNHKVEKFQKN
ncbi:MAG: c-type cytochrome [Chitinophagaceae bacterium]|nr:c-type cytochrome [Chitinophagaceae bacterium]